MATFDFWNLVKLGGRLVSKGFATPMASYLIKCGLIAGVISAFFTVLTSVYAAYHDILPGDLASKLFNMVNDYESNFGYIILYTININALCTAIYSVVQMLLTFTVAFITFLAAFALFLRTDGAKRALVKTQQQLTGKLFC